MSRAHIRLFFSAAAVLSVLAFMAGPAQAQANSVSGQVVLKAKIALSPSAVAVVTIADRSPNGGGTLIGQQRIDGVTGGAIPFDVPFDPSIINQKHAYSVVASIVDGGTEYQSDPVPTITGGPTSGLELDVNVPSLAQPAQIPGTIALPSGVTLSPTAVAYAVIENQTTGRVVARQVIASPTTAPIPFTVAYDASLINPDDTYVAAAAVIDGTTLYQTSSSTPITPGGTFDLTVAKTSTTIPAPAPSGSPTASGSPVASGSPQASQSTQPTQVPSNTPKPSKTPKPTATPSPVVTPTSAPTASPTPAPTESAQPSASVAPSESAVPSESPGPIVVTGQAFYREPATLSSAAVLTVAVVQLSADGQSLLPVGETEVNNPGQVPISFSVTLDPALLNPNEDAFAWASLIDGTNAWTSGGGVPVATNGAPTTGVQMLLTFRPDLIEGQVTGLIGGLPSGIGMNAWAMAFILDTSDGSTLGVQTGPIHGSNLIPFSVPFLTENVDPTKTYVVGAAVFDDVHTYRSDQAVPVITNGNPFSGIQLNMISVGPSPTPTIAPTPTLAPTATPAPTVAPATPAPVATATPSGGSSTSGGGVDPVVFLGVLALVIIGGGAVLYFMRR